MKTYGNYDKKSIRKAILRERNFLLESEILDKSLKIQKNVIKTSIFLDAKTVGIYSNIGSEVQTNLIMENIVNSSKKLAYPRVVGDKIQFFSIENNDLSKMKVEKNRFNIPEPPYNDSKVIDFFDLLIIPGIAFDRKGYRIGYGYGYYDRYLSKRNFLKSIGLGYEFQVLDFAIPKMTHDQKLNMIITENRIIYC